MAERWLDLPWPLAQGLEPGDTATLLTTVVGGGVIGVDATPVTPGHTVAPGIELPDLAFDVAAGETVYVEFDAFVVESNLPQFPKGMTVNGIHL